ncbi:uracil-DNA glycosylase [Undibacterium sp. Di27W]|uniref:uracil-DNA glycosylase n=1 Tax=Undibacterium sp. Di27W TaxID=3413036 RepID=UPI003BF2DDF2
MQAFDIYNRQRALHELGLGPMWLLRDAEPDMPAVVMETSETPETAVAPAFDHTPQPVVVNAAAEVAAAWSEPEVIAPKDQPEAQPEAQFEAPAFESSLEADDWIAQAIPTDLPVEEIPSVSHESSVSMLSWDALQPMVETCRQCGLCQGRKKAVFGTGDKQAKWLFVGEGPGYNENLQGLPFVGAAGQLLDNMLKALGVPRGEQSYIANIVKCRPTDAQGKDRPPTADEIAACLPYLHRQIALIQPQIIVALGKTAAVSLLGMDLETPVGQLRGRVHQLKGIPVVATYHPAYLLRKPADKAKAWADLCLAIKALSAS